MSSKATTLLTAVGVLMMLAGLCILPTALGDKSDTSALQMAMCIFSGGALIGALGTYLKARVLKAGIVPAEIASEPTKRKVRGGCDLCGTEMPVVLCTVHQVHVCGNCLAQHYDQRSCAYVPSKRAAAAKTSKAMAKAKGA